MGPEQIVIKQGDITGESTDAIVNAANTELLLGAGVAGAIRREGGPEIEEECRRIGPIPLGEAAITTGGKLKARYVIHAASMGLGGLMTTEQSLRDSVRNSLLRAHEKGLKTVAFPAIGTGVAGFPTDLCAEIMLGEIDRFLREQKTSIRKVHVVLFDAWSAETFQEVWEKLQVSQRKDRAE